MKDNDSRKPHMDNFKVCVISCCMPHLESAIEMAFDDCAYPDAHGGPPVVTHVKMLKATDKDAEKDDESMLSRGDRIELKRSCDGKESDGFKLLPFPMDLKATIEFAKGFLRTASPGEEPDHDGSNSLGFKVTNSHNFWSGHKIIIEATWAMHGK